MKRAAEASESDYGARVHLRTGELCSIVKWKRLDTCDRLPTVIYQVDDKCRSGKGEKVA